jgi:hypothetical protein
MSESEESLRMSDNIYMIVLLAVRVLDFDVCLG